MHLAILANSSNSIDSFFFLIIPTSSCGSRSKFQGLDASCFWIKPWNLLISACMEMETFLILPRSLLCFCTRGKTVAVQLHICCLEMLLLTPKIDFQILNEMSSSYISLFSDVSLHISFCLFSIRQRRTNLSVPVYLKKVLFLSQTAAICRWVVGQVLDRCLIPLHCLRDCLLAYLISHPCTEYPPMQEHCVTVMWRMLATHRLA